MNYIVFEDEGKTVKYSESDFKKDFKRFFETFIDEEYKSASDPIGCNLQPCDNCILSFRTTKDESSLWPSCQARSYMSFQTIETVYKWAQEHPEKISSSH